MNSEQLTRELADIETNRISMIAELDRIYTEIQKAMPEEASVWIDKEVEQKIGESASHVQSLGSEKLREMKRKIDELKNNLSQLVVNEFQNKNNWPHRNEEELHASKYQGSHVKEPFHRKVFREIISPLGAILAEFGLLKNSNDSYSTWKPIAEGKYLYSINPAYDVIPTPNLKTYNELLREYKKLTNNIVRVNKELTEAKAKELWNNI